MCCVRIKHSESGAKAIGKDSRSKDTNLKNAFKRLIETKEFKTWLRIKTAREMMTAEEKEKQKREIEESVDKMMLEENILVETKVDGKWVKGERDIK